MKDKLIQLTFDALEMILEDNSFEELMGLDIHHWEIKNDGIVIRLHDDRHFKLTIEEILTS